MQAKQRAYGVLHAKCSQPTLHTVHCIQTWLLWRAYPRPMSVGIMRKANALKSSLRPLMQLQPAECMLYIPVAVCNVKADAPNVLIQKHSD